MMYPYETDENEELVGEEIEADEEIAEEPPMEWGVNFKTGQMTGGKVTGSKAVAVWAWNALKTARFRFETSTFEYGSELEDLIGIAISQDEASMLVNSIVRDALLPNQYIIGIDNFDCTIDSDKLSISFTLITDFGEEELNVTI